MFGSEGTTLTGDDFSCTEIDKFDNTVVIEKNILRELARYK